jgi:hypothetical protein
MDQYRVFGLPAPQRQQQSIEHQFCVNTTAHGPAHQSTRVQVQHHSQVQPTLVGADVGDVGEPRLVYAVWRELSIQMVRRNAHQDLASLGSAFEHHELSRVVQ